MTIQPLNPDECPPLQLCCEDSLRALSLAECEGWQKCTGLPAGAPQNALADLARTHPETGAREKALLCGPILDEDLQDAYKAHGEEVPEPTFYFLLFQYEPEVTLEVVH